MIGQGQAAPLVATLAGARLGARPQAGEAWLKYTDATGVERVARYTNSDGAARRVLWSPPQ